MSKGLGTEVGLAERVPSKTDVYVGERVLSIRLSRGMTARALAKSAGIELLRLQICEKGLSRFGARELLAVARALGVKVTALFPETEFGWDVGLSDDTGGRHREGVPLRGEKRELVVVTSRL